MRILLAVLLATLGLPCWADSGYALWGDLKYAPGFAHFDYVNADAPKGYAMLGDLLIARPLLICATVIGAAAFVVSLPFSALGGNVKEAGRALVVEPGREAFVRCLGCTESGYNNTRN